MIARGAAKPCRPQVGDTADRRCALAPADVAQTSGLLYRRLAACKVRNRSYWVGCCFLLLCGRVMASGAVFASDVSTTELVTNVPQLRALTFLPTNILCRVNCEGVVFWASPARDIFLLNGDELGGIRVEMDLRNYPPLQLGQKVRLEGEAVAGNGSLRQTFVDNDGLHPAVETSESLYL